MRIGIIGCGNMGQALLSGIITKGYTKRRNIFCSDRDREKISFLRTRLGVRVAGSNSEVVKKSDVIILAVKPQDLDAIVQGIAVPLEGKLLISICAGITTKRLESCFGRVAVVRVMPNMPGQISQGISAVSLGRYATAKNKEIAASIFSCIGEVVKVKEELMDAVTAISGSGPAYFFYLSEHLVKAAKKMGIPSNIARRLVIKTALGSAMLMNQVKDDPQILRKRVGSRGGTTEAAFKVFKKEGLDKILSSAFKAAAKRSRQLKQ